jgi:hypothetical protein
VYGCDWGGRLLFILVGCNYNIIYRVKYFCKAIIQLQLLFSDFTYMKSFVCV